MIRYEILSTKKKSVLMLSVGCFCKTGGDMGTRVTFSEYRGRLQKGFAL